MNDSPQNSEIVNSRRAGVIENSDEEDWSAIVECTVLERSPSDRVIRADEEHRRRTIIVEKKNGSYGFTLQSYGIHYKREQEIEMVTYVDYVEYDGPAFKAGMREGDVILSINGHEMDRADHKTLVNFIKKCDSRMRMVVSFEDCVKKVELHMRYIELQRALQSRLAELERLCEKERSILMGKWKTHSLPARKKASDCGMLINECDTSDSASVTFNSSTVQYCRPATSTDHLLLYSIYADGRACLLPRNAACFVAIGPPRSRSDYHYFLSKNTDSNDSINLPRGQNYHKFNGLPSTPAKSKPNNDKPTTNSTTSQSLSKDTSDNIHQTSHNNLCVACISGNNSGTNSNTNINNGNNQRQRDKLESGIVDVYDVASPCCDPNCVPSRKRREKLRKAREQSQQQQQQQQQQQHCTNAQNCSRSSGHSLHSVTNSDASITAESGASCSTSLSTDTLYWDPNIQHRPPPCIQYSKPKSWDNLTTKSFGGYGFGYGYLDTSMKTHSAERGSGKGYHRSKIASSSLSTCGSGQRKSSLCQMNSNSSTNRRIQPTKSTESLLNQSPYQSEADSSHSCECLDKTDSKNVNQHTSSDKNNKRHEDSPSSNCSSHHHHHHHHPHHPHHHHHHVHHHQSSSSSKQHKHDKPKSSNNKSDVTHL